MSTDGAADDRWIELLARGDNALGAGSAIETVSLPDAIWCNLGGSQHRWVKPLAHLLDQRFQPLHQGAHLGQRLGHVQSGNVPDQEHKGKTRGRGRQPVQFTDQFVSVVHRPSPLEVSRLKATCTNREVGYKVVKLLVKVTIDRVQPADDTA
jgi:hypothetical protein